MKFLYAPSPLDMMSGSPKTTERLGAALGALLQMGDLVLLTGPYGAGKTCFVRGIAGGAGVHDLRCVTSPTFVLMNVYRGRLPVHHLDCHRLSPAEVVDLGLGDILAAGAAVIEWGDRVPSRLAESALTVDIGMAGPRRRILRASGQGPRGRALLRALRNKIEPGSVRRRRG